VFVDEATFRVSAGAGGNGCVAFRREKFVPRGGPIGGDGGKGGDVILVADSNKHTLLDLHHRKHIKAESGSPGMGKGMSGKDGADEVILVPCGTLVYDDETEEVLADLVAPGERVVVARGGRGGWGNMRFKTPTRQAPDFAKSGLPGVSRQVRLELKLLADVGIVGFPSVGKSTLISRLSNARPKIAAYPFTTLVPNLGLVQWRDLRSFVVADLPGLIEGAAEGRGLGHRFLRHLERVRAIVHVLEVPQEGAPELGVERSALGDYAALRRELQAYDPALAELPEIVVVKKVDLPATREALGSLEAELAARGLGLLALSAATGEGLKGLLDAMGRLVFGEAESGDPSAG
jgi:GTPase